MGARKFDNIAGRQFGRLLAVRRTERTRLGWKWLCACTCGGEATVLGARLRNGTTASCGCLLHEWRQHTMRNLRGRHGKPDIVDSGDLDVGLVDEELESIR